MIGRVYVTGVGNVAFAATFAKSVFDTEDGIPLWYVQDRTSGCKFKYMEWIISDAYEFMPHTGRGGCNALWTQCVKHAFDCNLDFCIVANDDVMFPSNGWFGAIEQIFERNPHVAMVGIGSDGAWEDEHKKKERWFTDPSLVTEAAEHCKDFRDRPVKYVHHVSGPLWACRPKLWLDAGGIPENLFWGWGEIVPSIELRKIGYQSVAVQYPCTILHYGGGAYWDIHSDPERDASFARRSAEMGDEGKYIFERYGNGHAHLMAQEFDAKLPTMGLPPIKYDGKEWS